MIRGFPGGKQLSGTIGARRRSAFPPVAINSSERRARPIRSVTFS
jgi:hypothetical protein